MERKMRNPSTSKQLLADGFCVFTIKDLIRTWHKMETRGKRRGFKNIRLAKNVNWEVYKS